MAKAFIGWRYPTAITALDLQPSSIRDGGGALPDDDEAIASWLDLSANGYDLTAVGSPLYSATDAAAVLAGTSGGGSINSSANPQYFQRASVANLEVDGDTEFTLLMALTPTVPTNPYATPEAAIAGDLTPIPFHSRWGSGAVIRLPSGSSLIGAGVSTGLGEDILQNGTPDMGAYQSVIGAPHYGPRKYYAGYMLGIPDGWMIEDAGDAASGTGLSPSGTAAFYFTNGSDYIAGWKQTSSGSTRYSDLDTEVGTAYTIRDGLKIKNDYSKAAVVLDDGLLVVYFSGDDETAKTFAQSLYLPYASATQQTSYGLTASGNLSGKVTNTTISIRLPFISGDTGCAVEYKLAHEATYHTATPAKHEDNVTDDWIGTIFNCAPGETYDVRVTTAGEGAITTTAVTRKPMAVPTGTVRAATTATIESVITAAAAGDVIELASGDYAARTISKSGTQSAPIQFRPAAGATVNLERWTISGTDLWFDNLKTHYAGVGCGFQISSTATRIQLTRIDIDGEGAAESLQCVNAYGDEIYIADAWIAGANSPRVPYWVSFVNETFAGEGVEASKGGVEIMFCDISRVADVYSDSSIEGGVENIVMGYTKIHDHSDDTFECDHSLGSHAMFRCIDWQAGNNCISTQEGEPNEINGPVYVFQNQLTGSLSSIYKHATDVLHLILTMNTIVMRQSSQYGANFFQQPDGVYSNNIWACKDPTIGDNQVTYGTLSYGADADWSGHMAVWDGNAYLATSSKIMNMSGSKSLASLQAKNVELNSVLLANYGTTIAPAWSGDWANTLFYLGSDGKASLDVPTASGIMLQFDTEQGFTLHTKHADGVADAPVRVARNVHTNPVIVAVRYKRSTVNGKEIILDTGERAQVTTQVSQSSPLVGASDVLFVGANGRGEDILQASVSHVKFFRSALTDSELNQQASAMATAAGTTWTSI